MTRMPAIQKKAQEIFEKEPNKSVNPDEVVSVGAAIQAGVLGGEVKDITLLDVTPLSLGLETLGGVMTKLIDRNTTIPVEKKQIFSTAADNQPAVEVHVLQGEREMAADNKTLGKFILDGIPPAPRGVPQIEVTFKIDANGILNVSALDKATNKKKDITITASTNLSEDEVDKMVEEATKHAADDKKKKERAEVRNEADSLVFNSQKLLDENKDKIDKSKAEDIQTKVNDLKKSIEKEDFDKDIVKDKIDDLNKSLQEIGKKLYEQAAKEVEKEEKEKAKDKKKTEDDKEKKDKSDGDVQEGEVV
jgi:molecular chaperone DnaK